MVVSSSAAWRAGGSELTIVGPTVVTTKAQLVARPQLPTNVGGTSLIDRPRSRS